MTLNRTLYGTANRLKGSTVKPRKRKHHDQPNMIYRNVHGKRIKALGVPQIPDHVHRHIVAGFEPTPEMEAEAARMIDAAKALMRELHLSEMRDEPTKGETT